ncbi:hypothetical protein BI292_04010 [Pseudomonas sp. 43NM1]|uniref:hypothetical protein n=1 Tax=Pseudomonas sp. 43NM1 TaxID=1904755 RepID=UPI000C331B74|nr:hypothetical protein [Pseudomonas sp. 43NM1]PKH18688.1 hypothetical protein BI292_04010 [Pseudomonas sp. 43NM1]
MDVPEAIEYLAILVGSNGRVLLRTEPGLVGGFFIRVELSVDKSPESAIIESVFNESGLKVKVDAVGEGVYFGARGMCGYFVVKIVGSEEAVGLDGFSVDWYSIEGAANLISGLKSDSEFELERSVLVVASNIVEMSGALVDEKFKGVIESSEFESFKDICVDVERILSGGSGDFWRRGISSDLVIGMLDETQKRISCGEIDSEYEQNILALVGRDSRSKKHERYLIETISIYTARAYDFLLSGNSVGCNEECLSVLKYVDIYDRSYPGEGRARRERGFKGGTGKAKTSAEISRKIGMSESLIRQTILNALRAHAPYRARATYVSIVDMIIDDVYHGVKCQGIERNRDDLCGCVLNMLAEDVVAKKIVKFR